MVNKILDLLSKPARWVLLIGSLVYLALFAVATAGQIGGRFLSVVSNLIILIAGIGVLAVVPLFMFLKKENISKIVFTILGGYWLISSILGELGTAAAWDMDGAPGIVITASVFSFILGLCLLGVLVLLVLNFVLKNDFYRLLAVFVMAAVVLFSLVTGILWMVAYGQMNFGWTSYVNAVADYIVVPVVVLFGYFYFYGVPQMAIKEKAPKAKKAEKAKEEPALETSEEQPEEK